MNLNDFNSLKHNKINENKDGILANFIKEFKNTIENFIKNPSSPISSTNLSENSIYVVRDINDSRLSLVNIDNGQDIDIYTAHSKDEIEKLHQKGIFDNICEISKENLYSLNLGSNITIKNGKCIPYYGEIEIKNPDAVSKLEDMYFCLEQEKTAIYSVLNISDEKIYLTDTKEGGCFSISKEAYPNFKIGDLVKNIDGKYTLI